MKLRKESWLHLAKQLEPGARRYRDHEDCGAGRTLVVSAGELGWSAHCFRCNADGYEAYGVRNLTELQNVNYGLAKNELTFERGSCKLPNDFTKEIPDASALWLYKAGIFKDTAEFYGFGYSRSLNRVVLPVYKDSELVYMQARATDGRKPKYLNNSALGKGSVLFRSAGTYTLPLVCVITEDILSAVRVGALQVQAFSTLGTALSDEQAYQIQKCCTSAYIWYDGDAAGRAGAYKVLRKLSLLGVHARIITTTKDPKLYSNREMQDILNRSFDCQIINV